MIIIKKKYSEYIFNNMKQIFIGKTKIGFFPKKKKRRLFFFPNRDESICDTVSTIMREKLSCRL